MNKFRPVPAVIAAVVRDNEVLLVQRKNNPNAGLWGFPGGKIEPGETIEEAAQRELLEETAVKAKAVEIFKAHSFIDYKNDGSLSYHFVILSVLCQWVSGEALAGDDALKASWYKLGDLKNPKIELVPHVWQIAFMAAELAKNR